MRSESLSVLKDKSKLIGWYGSNAPMKSELSDSLFPQQPDENFQRCVSGFAPFATVTDCGHNDHFVQFYENDEWLLKAVSAFIGAGLGAGDGGIVIATQEHRDALEKQLLVQGINVTGVKARGQYVSLDAVETLSKFMVRDLPDRDLFNEVIGGLVVKTTKGERGLRAFGEMVALLWAEGKEEAALRLEELWNDLGKRQSFSLFCAYPLNDFRGHAHSEAFVHICQAHSRVLPAESYGRPGDTMDQRLRAIAELQQKSVSLERETFARKRAEEETRRSKEQIISFLETASIGMHWVGPDGIILWANAADFKMLGYEREEYVGHPIAEFHADQSVITNILARLWRNEKLQNQEANLKCRDGSIKTVLVDCSVLWEGDRFLHTQCFTRDITDQRTAELNGRRLAAIVEFSDDGIISKDLNSTITSWNKGAERIFGYAAEEAIGQPVSMLIPADHIDEEPAIISRICRGERIDHYETVRKRKDGTLIELSLTISPVKDGAGKIIGASKIVRDISESKRKERLLREAKEQLARANEELERRVRERTASLEGAMGQMEEFSYTVSHDLRAPLRAMQGYSKALLEDFEELLTAAPEARHYLKRIAENSVRLDRMIADVLTFSRLARAELKLEPLSLDKLVRDLVQEYPFMQPPRARIHIEPLADVFGHEPSLVQAISNLLTNAVKFVPQGVVPTVRVSTENREGEVRLWIEDNGIGIDPKYHHRLFGMFERIHPTLDFEGTGVGLAIVRKATERMRGKVGVESDGTGGSRFWIQLQAAPRSE